MRYSLGRLEMQFPGLYGNAKTLSVGPVWELLREADRVAPIAALLDGELKTCYRWARSMSP